MKQNAAPSYFFVPPPFMFVIQNLASSLLTIATLKSQLFSLLIGHLNKPEFTTELRVLFIAQILLRWDHASL